jgi:hypothetical protein
MRTQSRGTQLSPGDLVSVTHRGDIIDPNPEGFWGCTETHRVFIECGTPGVVIDTRRRPPLQGEHLVNFGDRACWMAIGALEAANESR